MKERSLFFGNVSAVSDTNIMQEPPSVPPSASRKDLSGEAMYEYLHNGTLDGISVALADRNLPFDSEEEMRDALQLVRREKVFLEWLSPDTGKDKYAELLERANNGEIIIEDQTLQYDAGKSAFMALVRYCEVEHVLSPRYNFIRERDE